MEKIPEKVQKIAESLGYTKIVPVHYQEATFYSMGYDGEELPPTGQPVMFGELVSGEYIELPTEYALLVLSTINKEEE